MTITIKDAKGKVRLEAPIPPGVASCMLTDLDPEGMTMHNGTEKDVWASAHLVSKLAGLLKKQSEGRL